MKLNLSNASLLLGPLTLDSLTLAFRLFAEGQELAPRVGMLCVFEVGFRSAEFYGVEPDGMPNIGLVGRWGVANIQKQDLVLKTALEPAEEQIFTELIGISSERMHEMIEARPHHSSQIRRGSGLTPVSAIASGVMANVMALAGARPYEPQVHGAVRLF